MMGKVINGRTLLAKELPQLLSPVLICSNKVNFEKAITEAGYQTVSLNLPLAKKLAELPEREMPTAVSGIIRDLLTSSSPIYLTDFEMLFNPQYELNVFRLFIDLSHRNKLIVKWCGKVEDDTLIYAEQGFTDYRCYNINDYAITVVK